MTCLVNSDTFAKQMQVIMPTLFLFDIVGWSGKVYPLLVLLLHTVEKVLKISCFVFLDVYHLALFLVLFHIEIFNNCNT